MNEERRPPVNVPGSSLGAGVGQVTDWNSDQAITSGWWYSEPNVVINSPANADGWMGFTETIDPGDGIQTIWRYLTFPADIDAEMEYYCRRFYTDPNGMRIYSNWYQPGGGSSGSRPPTGPAGGDLSGTYPNPVISPAAKSGLMVDVFDEGLSKVPDATRLDFVGAGVTVTQDATGVAHVSIPGGGGGSGTTPAVHMRRVNTNGPNIAGDSSQVPVAFGTSVDDVGGIIYSSTTPFEWTVPEAGTYLLFLSLQYTGSTGSGVRRDAVIQVNGVSIANNDAHSAASASLSPNATAVKVLAAGDKVKFCAMQNSGGTVALTTTTYNNASITKVDGIKGDKGDAGNISGPAGGDLTGTFPNPSIKGVTFTFAAAATVWSLPHNLNKTHVQVYSTDNGLVETYGDVTHVDANNARINWTVPMTGFARVSA